MKQEKKVFLVSTILNFAVASIKLIGGIVFHFSSLIADSLHSFSDFITDIIANIANKIGKKRANKRYPFGYGMIENISNLAIGFILLGLGIYIFVQGFHPKEVTIQPLLFVILAITLGLKLLVVLYLYHSGKKYRNNTLIVSAKESSADLISSIIVSIVSILLIFEEKVPALQYADTVGSILISIIVFRIALKIIFENIQYLLGMNEDNEEIIKTIQYMMDNYKMIKASELKLVKFGNYYTLYITLELDERITLKELFRIENKLKKDIRKQHLKIKFIQIEPKEYKPKKENLKS